MNTQTITRSNFLDAFRSHLTTAAERAGVDLTGLEMTPCDVDRTWGDRVGLGFYGASEEVRERAAVAFRSFACKHFPGSYEAQQSVGEPLEMTRYRFPNGANGWSEKSAAELEESGANHTEPGIAVPFVYYPCAD